MNATKFALNENFNENQVKTLKKNFVGGAQAATVAAVAAANAGGTYTAAEQTLINELKTKLNALLTSLKAAGLVA